MSEHIPINLFHILIVGPFFLYVAMVRGQLMPWIFNLLIALGLLLIVYHGMKTVKKYYAHSLSTWINLIHVIGVAPLLIYIGVKGYDTPRWAFELMAMLAFGVVGYHLYAIVQELQMRNTTQKASSSVASSHSD